jgi:predicted chitinase
LIEANGRGLVLVVSDCIAPIWRNGAISTALQIWSRSGMVAILQMLPDWLWARTALGRGVAAQFSALAAGIPNYQLTTTTVSTWYDIDLATSIKIPVVTLEPEKFTAWAEMLAGKGGAWSAGIVFEPELFSGQEVAIEFDGATELDAEDRVQSFRLTASPIARRLAGLLAAAPVISLPIVRILQSKVLTQLQPVHVAEVFLGGLLKPLSEITAKTNPNYVQYDFIEGVRDLLLESVPSSEIVNIVEVVSEFVANRLGVSLEDFAAVIRNPRQFENSDLANRTRPFALLTAQILKRLGGEYVRFAEQVEQVHTTSISQSQTANISIDRKVLNVPYFSQIADQFAPSASSQAAAIAMALSYHGIQPQQASTLTDEINQWLEENEESSHDNHTFAQVYHAYGFDGGFRIERTWKEIKAEIDAERPVVVAGRFAIARDQTVNLQSMSDDFSPLSSEQVTSDVGGVVDAHAANATSTIYLSDTLFQADAAMIDSKFGAAGVLSEETFHWLDDRVGTDTAGDEGELAKELLFGSTLSVEDITALKEEITALKMEDDRVFIRISNQFTFVCIIGYDKEGYIVHNPDKNHYKDSDSRAKENSGNAVHYSYKLMQRLCADNDEIWTHFIIPRSLTAEQILSIAPDADPVRVRELLPHLNRTMVEFRINTRLRQAYFITTVTYESDSFNVLQEFASGTDYEGRRDLGNINLGDGAKFKGRGLLHLTGKYNYQACSNALGVDLITHPERLADYDLACRSAGWFWSSNGFNEEADKDEKERFFRKMGQNSIGISRKLEILNLAKEILIPSVELSLEDKFRSALNIEDKQKKSKTLATIKRSPVELISAKGINYRELEKLLKAKKWDKADRQTNGLILKLANQEKNPWLKVEDVKGLSIKDLLTIDRLWVHYSDGLYGFSVQKQIYVECGGKLDFSLPSDETWNKFCDLIGWPTLGNLMTMRDFYAIKKSGSLPLSFVKIEGGHKARAFFFSLIETAKV